MSQEQFDALRQQREVMLARCGEALAVGDAVPDVTLPDAYGTEVNVSARMADATRSGTLGGACQGAVLVWYRGSW